MAEQKIVEAAGVGKSTRSAQGKAIEAAMVTAIKQCAAEGVTDPAEVKKRMMAAREKAKRGG